MLVSSALCLQRGQLLQSHGWLAAGEHSSVITAACLLKERAGLAPSFPAWRGSPCAASPCPAAAEGWGRAPGSAPHAGPPAHPQEDPGPLERIPTVCRRLCGIRDMGVALHTPPGHRGLLLLHLWGKLQQFTAACFVRLLW